MLDKTYTNPTFFTLSLLAFCLAIFGIMASSVNAAQKNPPAEMRKGSIRYATIGKGAPTAIKRLIRAGNQITNQPYRWGGGHSWNRKGRAARPDRGYDCSGSVSYLLQKAGLLDYPMTSGGFMRYGKPGKGYWITLYANRKHVFMVVAGLRWDTSYITDGNRSGPGWSETMRPTRGFKVRHIFVPRR